MKTPPNQNCTVLSKFLEIWLLLCIKKGCKGNTAIVSQSRCLVAVSLYFSPLYLPHFLFLAVFQSGRPPFGPERAMPAYVPPGWACGQELHPIQDQTSLSPPGSRGAGGGATLSPGPPQQPKALLHWSRSLSDNKHFNKDAPNRPRPALRVMSLALFKVTLIVSVLQHTRSKLIYRNFSSFLFPEMPLICVCYIFIIYLHLEYIHLYSSIE